MKQPTIAQKYASAREQYAALGVDTDKAIKALAKTSLSLHCWQGDDVNGFEKSGSSLSGGIQATGNYPGKARSVDELRMDLSTALDLIPGSHRVNLHAIYGEFGNKPVDRDEVEPRHFKGWIDWAKQRNTGLDFNATLFSHPLAASGLTLSSKNKKIRQFWVDHVSRCRAIGAAMGKALGTPTVHNLWIPDGMKDICIDKAGYRAMLLDSLDEIYKKKYAPTQLLDAVECKLFGIGSESFVVGSHELYLAYALEQELMVCLDMGHFHPTESIADKISSLLHFMPEILVHVSRGIRWDSDHVVLFDDQLRDLAAAIVRSNALNRTHLALDYFDASINRIAAWVIGARATQKALLNALCEPVNQLIKLEAAGDYTSRLALIEESKTMPIGDVWNYFCYKNNVPTGMQWMESVKKYEGQVLTKR